MIFSQTPKFILGFFFIEINAAFSSNHFMKMNKLIRTYLPLFKNKFIPLRIMILVSVLLTGCSSFQSDTEPWEGISGEILHVALYEFFLFEENAETGDIKNQILVKLNQRAALIIASHISINLSREKVSKNTDAVLNKKIDEIINTGRLINYSCSENNYCSANSEYNLDGLQQTLDSLNNSE